jgi:hypothetical protein
MTTTQSQSGMASSRGQTFTLNMSWRRSFPSLGSWTETRGKRVGWRSKIIIISYTTKAARVTLPFLTDIKHIIMTIHTARTTLRLPPVFPVVASVLLPICDDERGRVGVCADDDECSARL